MATLTWVKTSGGSWSSPASWVDSQGQQPAQPPQSGDTALVSKSGNYTVTLDIDASVGTVVVSDKNATLALGGHTLTATELDLTGVVSGAGALNVTTFGADTGTIVASGGTLRVFGSISGTPTLAIANVAGSNLEIDGTASVSTVTLNSPNETLTIANGGKLTVTNSTGWQPTFGTIAMAGGTLAISSGAFKPTLSLIGYGVVQAQTLTPGGGATIQALGGTLDLFGNVTVNFPFTIGTAVSSTLRLEGSLVSQSPISITSANQTLQVVGTLPFGGAETISAGTIDLAGGTLTGGFGYTLTSGGHLTGYGVVKDTIGVSGSGTVIANGGALDLVKSIGNASGLTLQVADSAASVMRLDGTVGAGNTFSFLGSHGAIELNDVQIKADGLNFAGTVDGMVVGSSTNDVSAINYINVQGVVTDASFVDSTHIRVSNGVTVLGTIALASPTTAPYVVLSLDSSTVGHTIGSGYDIFLSTVCYARGTHIMTAHGETQVEELAAGAQVMVLEGETLTPRTVRWIGERHIDVQAHPRPQAVAPVRIHRSAFAENVPHRDLVLSPDHAVLVEGCLIPVRRLINHDTITQDLDVQDVTYFHVELDSHAILLAEGLPAESYLDTGNRGFFTNADVPPILHPDLTDEVEEQRRAASSPLPFATSDQEVERAWRTLADRAWLLRTLADSRLTNEPAMRVICQGQALTPMTSRDGKHLFVLPADAQQVRIESRAAAPADTQPWSDDRRLLGVNVTRIVLRGPNLLEELPVDHPRLHRGWWPVERNGSLLARWTDGCATLPLPPLDGVTILELHATAGGMRYVVEEEATQAA